MADYSLNILRNTTPVENKDAAISILNQFEDHMIGQPISLLYYNEDGTISILFAIGKKNASDVLSGDETCGSDFYDIIGETSGKVFWEEFQNMEIVPTTDEFRIAHSPSETSFNAVVHEDNVLTIVNSKGIYKGDELVAPFRLEDIRLYKNITVNGKTYAGNIENILTTLIEAIGVKWEGTEQYIKFHDVTSTSYESTANKNRDIFHVTRTKQVGESYVEQHELYVGEDQVGGNYNTNISNVNLAMPKEVGGLEKGTTLGTLLKKGSISAILDDILFPTINPVIVQPSIKLELKNYLKVQERGVKGPTQDNFGYKADRGSVTYGSLGENAEYAGPIQTASIAYNPTNLDIQLNNESYTYSMTATFATHTNQPQTNKGQNYGKPYSEGSVTSNTITINTYYPYYTGQITEQDYQSKEVQGILDMVLDGSANKVVNSIPNRIDNTIVSDGEMYHLFWLVPGKEVLTYFESPLGVEENMERGYKVEEVKLDTLDGQSTTYTLYVRQVASNAANYTVKAYKNKP